MRVPMPQRRSTTKKKPHQWYNADRFAYLTRGDPRQKDLNFFDPTHTKIDAEYCERRLAGSQQPNGRTNLGLLEAEVIALMRAYPGIRYDFEPDAADDAAAGKRGGRLRFHMHLEPKITEPDGNVATHPWDVVMIYDNDFPRSTHYGGAARVYPTQETADAMMRRWRERFGSKTPNHLLEDRNGSIYFCNQSPEQLHSGSKSDKTTGGRYVWTTGKDLLDAAVLWINFYEYALLYESVKNVFDMHAVTQRLDIKENGDIYLGGNKLLDGTKRR
jgi:hypothetical protein